MVVNHLVDECRGRWRGVEMRACKGNKIRVACMVGTGSDVGSRREINRIVRTSSRKARVSSRPQGHSERAEGRRTGPRRV